MELCLRIQNLFSQNHGHEENLKQNQETEVCLNVIIK